MFLTCYPTSPCREPCTAHPAAVCGSCLGTGPWVLLWRCSGASRASQLPRNPWKSSYLHPAPHQGPRSPSVHFHAPLDGSPLSFSKVFPCGRLKFFTLVQYVFIYSVTSSGATDRKKPALSRVNLSQTCYLKTANDFSHQAGPLVQKSLGVSPHLGGPVLLGL